MPLPLILTITSEIDANGSQDLLAEATKFYTIEIFHAQQQRKDGKEAKFMNFGRERHEFVALQASTQQQSLTRSMKKKWKTEFCALWTNIKYPASLKF